MGNELVSLPGLLGHLAQVPGNVNLHIQQVHIHLSPPSPVEATDQFKALPPAEPDTELLTVVDAEVRASRSNGRRGSGFLRKGSHRPDVLKSSVRG